MWRALYNVVGGTGIEVGFLGSVLGSDKGRKAIKMRMGEGAKLARIRNRCKDGAPRILIHCSSAGELESAVPLIDAINNKMEANVLVSVFSPSTLGRWHTVKNATAVFFIPFDSIFRVWRLYELLEPDLLIYVKHDVWPNLTWQAASRRIPAVLVNGNFRPDSTRNRPVVQNFNREVLGSLTAIYAVAEDDAERFRSVAGAGITIEAIGDTRYDRVKQRAIAQNADQGKLRDVLKGRPVFVAGSTWPEDEELLIASWSKIHTAIPEAVMLLIPHEIGNDHIEKILQFASQHDQSISLVDEVETTGKPDSIILVNRTGVLAGLYGLGRIAYVGGAFGRGVHSVLEPAVFGIPVLFGPNHLMSHEARDLITLGAAREVKTADSIHSITMNALSNNHMFQEMGMLARNFVENRTGVSELLAHRLVRLARL